MAKRDIIKIRKALLRVLQEAGIDVLKIVIFGSYAEGRAKKDSDIDIIVVSKAFKDKDVFEKVELTKDVHWKLIENVMMPFDIMYYSDEEWDKGYSLIINTAKEKGKVIYG